ncbi:hypothetical protein [Pseudomonas phage COT4]|uniref:Uncharacterized protein n=1 Tax=Pseudomonas phage M5.1 TaxID=2873460 RepID=A0AAE8XDY4_9CAUD|nr:hypothetical protein QGX13_gp007 [Pseudomonas phage M5.1]UAV89608.1 hypothetical protein M51_7 [Pseudomonas phage M5.1]UGL61208.1 hypothetical protein [Pseudomonas phage COT4]
MVDKRKCYTMETGYSSGDFSFFRKNPNSIEVTRSHIYDMQTRAGVERWYLVDAYTERWASGHGYNNVIVLVNDKGVQIETEAFGWRRVTTEHEENLKERKDYEKFLTALSEASKLCPNGASRWFNEAVLENFEYTFEEILTYGDE